MLLDRLFGEEEQRKRKREDEEKGSQKGEDLCSEYSLSQKDFGNKEPKGF